MLSSSRKGSRPGCDKRRKVFKVLPTGSPQLASGRHPHQDSERLGDPRLSGDPGPRDLVMTRTSGRAPPPSRPPVRAREATPYPGASKPPTDGDPTADTAPSELRRPRHRTLRAPVRKVPGATLTTDRPTTPAPPLGLSPGRSQPARREHPALSPRRSSLTALLSPVTAVRADDQLLTA